MLKISRQVDLSLLLLADLSKLKKDQVLSLSAWANQKKLPYRFLSKVAVSLKKAKLITSKEGRDGGYRLAKSPDEISVREVIDVLEGPTYPVKCMRGENCSAQGYCGHRQVMNKLSTIVDDYLNQVNIKALC